MRTTDGVEIIASQKPPNPSVGFNVLYDWVSIDGEWHRWSNQTHQVMSALRSAEHMTFETWLKTFKSELTPLSEIQPSTSESDFEPLMVMSHNGVIFHV